MPEVPHITLGDHELPVPEQRIGRMENRISAFFMDLTRGDLDNLTDGSVLVSLGRDKCYDALCMVVPLLAKRMPRYEFAGYGSQEAYDAKEYDEDADHSPTWPEIVGAFETAKSVNRFDMFDGLKNFAKGLLDKADPTMVGQIVNVVIAEAVSKSSPNSAPLSGESASMSSTTNGLTTPLHAA